MNIDVWMSSLTLDCSYFRAKSTRERERARAKTTKKEAKTTGKTTEKRSI